MIDGSNIAIVANDIRMCAQTITTQCDKFSQEFAWLAAAHSYKTNHELKELSYELLDVSFKMLAEAKNLYYVKVFDSGKFSDDLRGE